MNELIQPSHSAWKRPRIDTELLGVCTALSSVLSIPAFILRMSFLTGGLLFLLTFVASLSNSFEPLISATAIGITSSTVLLYLLLWWALPRQSLLADTSEGNGLNLQVRGRPANFTAAQAVENFFASPSALTMRWVATSAILGLTTTAVVISAYAILVGDLTFVPAILGQADITKIGIGLGLLVMGATLGRLPLDAVDTARWSGRFEALPKPILFSVAIALLIILAGSLVLVESFFGPAAVLITTAITAAMVLVLSAVMVPWIRKLWSSIKAESTERALVHQQAEIASHLHDSVLQTLTLISRNSTSEAQRKQLARTQEKELRRWLYADSPTSELDATAAQIGAAISQIAQEIESLHHVEIEVVLFGEADSTADTAPLLAASKEAINNAARHAKVGIQIFCDLDADPLEIFIRDRGPGFELQNIADGRLGVKESIIGRMERAGGTARIYPAIGGGTEVALSLPLNQGC